MPDNLLPNNLLPTGAEPVARWSREQPRAVAVIEDNVSWSYATLARNIAQASVVLAASGVKPGMIVGIQCESRYLNLVLLLAGEILGAAHTALVESDLTADTSLSGHCDFLCVQSDICADLTHIPAIRLSPRF